MNTKLLGLLSGTAILLAACSQTCDVEQASTTTAAPGSADDFKTNTPYKIYFDFDSSKLSDAAKKRVEAQACWLNTYPGTKITVEGHTDNRGTAEYNMALGNSRANSTAKALASLGVSQDRVTVVSYGKERLETDDAAEEAHARNRRTVTVVE
jgi:peptidoglycan-associated lipoprotein